MRDDKMAYLLDYKSDIGFWKLLNIYIYFCFLSLSLFKKKKEHTQKKPWIFSCGGPCAEHLTFLNLWVNLRVIEISAAFSLYRTCHLGQVLQCLFGKAEMRISQNVLFSVNDIFCFAPGWSLWGLVREFISPWVPWAFCGSFIQHVFTGVLVTLRPESRASRCSHQDPQPCLSVCGLWVHEHLRIDDRRLDEYLFW